MKTRLLAAAIACTVNLSVMAQAQAQLSAAPAAKPTGLRTAKYSGGAGSTWNAGRDAHGFAGTYGGCRYTGFAGPNGYRLDKVC